MVEQLQGSMAIEGVDVMLRVPAEKACLAGGVAAAWTCKYCRRLTHEFVKQPGGGGREPGPASRRVV